MTNVTTLKKQNTSLSPRDYSPQQLRLIRRTVAKDCDETEFDLFMEMARHQGLDPFRRQIYAIVTNKNNPEKRQLAVVTGIDGYRAKAQRCGDYRPGEVEITNDDQAKDPKTNPAGIVRATYTAYKQDSRGEWHPVFGYADWEEFAPLAEIWEYDQSQGKRVPTGQFEIAKGKDNWRKMPRRMIGKCAEADALRKGWPEEFSGLYVSEEMDQAQVIDLTPSEAVEEADKQDRQKRIGGGKTVNIAWKYGDSPERIPMGQFADRAIAHIKKTDSAAELEWWKSFNRHELEDFWAEHKADAFEVKRALDDRLKELKPENSETS